MLLFWKEIFKILEIGLLFVIPIRNLIDTTDLLIKGDNCSVH